MSQEQYWYNIGILWYLHRYILSKLILFDMRIIHISLCNISIQLLYLQLLACFILHSDGCIVGNDHSTYPMIAPFYQQREPSRNCGKGPTLNAIQVPMTSKSGGFAWNHGSNLWCFPSCCLDSVYYQQYDVGFFILGNCMKLFYIWFVSRNPWLAIQRELLGEDFYRHSSRKSSDLPALLFDDLVWVQNDFRTLTVPK